MGVRPECVWAAVALVLATAWPARAASVLGVDQIPECARADWEFEWTRVNDLIDTLRARNNLHPTHSRVTLPHTHIQDIVLDTQSLYWESDHDALDVALRRTAALIADLEDELASSATASLRQALQSIVQQASTLPSMI